LVLERKKEEKSLMPDPDSNRPSEKGLADIIGS
jgi:hypothetical protein